MEASLTGCHVGTMTASTDFGGVNVMGLAVSQASLSGLKSSLEEVMDV